MVHVYRFVLSNEKYVVMNKVKGGISRAWFIACYLTLKESIRWNRGVLYMSSPQPQSYHKRQGGQKIATRCGSVERLSVREVCATTKRFQA